MEFAAPISVFPACLAGFFNRHGEIFVQEDPRTLCLRTISLTVGTLPWSALLEKKTFRKCFDGVVNVYLCRILKLNLSRIKVEVVLN